MDCKCVVTIEWLSIRHEQLQDITVKNTPPQCGGEERGDRVVSLRRLQGSQIFYYQIINRNHLREMKSSFLRGIILSSTEQWLRVSFTLINDSFECGCAHVQIFIS